MNLKLFSTIFGVLTLTFSFYSCKKDDDNGGGGGTGCSNINIVVSATVTDVAPCPSNNGSLAVRASGSSGFTYSKDGGATYQADSIFQSLAAGTYQISVKDANGCTAATSATVGTQAPGSNFAQVRTIIRSKCGGGNCHLNGQVNRGVNYDADCSIVGGWNALSNEVNAGAMPPVNATPLTQAEKSAITAWVNAGHLYSN